MTGWQMYSGDFNDRVANNFGVTETENSISSGKFDNWVNNVMDWTVSGSVADRSITNVAWVQNGVLGKYTAGAVGIYKCPADNYLSGPQRSAGFGKRNRSLSMNSMFGLFSDGESGDDTAKGIHWGDGDYIQFLKQTHVPKPAKTWVFLDEHPDSINDGFFICGHDATHWEDIPSSTHAGGCGFSFADGHAEIRKWRSATSVAPVRYYYPTMPNFDVAGRVDWNWYRERTGYVLRSTGQPQFNY